MRSLSQLASQVSRGELFPADHPFVCRPDTHEVAVYTPDEVLGWLDRVENAVVIEEDGAERHEGSHGTYCLGW
jgi:hypothetical protein